MLKIKADKMNDLEKLGFYLKNKLERLIII